MRLRIIGIAFLLLTASMSNAIAESRFARRADLIVAAYAKLDRFWGTVLVTLDGRVLFERAYGTADLAWSVPNSTSTRYEIASLTKAFTGVAIAQLAAAGKLDVHDSVLKYYPQGPPSWQPITIEQLLTHTSGLPNNEIKDFSKGIAVPYTADELIATFRDRPLRFAPGTSWAYTNTEYYLLAYIIEKVSGEAYGEYLTRHIFDPLGMKDSGFSPTTAVIPQMAEGYAHEGKAVRYRDYFDRSLELGAGGVHTTVRDLMRWDRALDGGQLLSPEWLKRIFTANNRGSYGYGWFVTQDHDGSRIWHEGSDPGYAAFIIRRPAQRLLIVVLSNLEDAPVREIASKLEQLAIGDQTAGNPPPTKK